MDISSFWWLFLIPLLFVLLQAVRYYQAIRLLRSMRFDSAYNDPIPEQDMPRWLIETAQPQVAALEAEGFCQRQGINMSLENGPDIAMPVLTCISPGEGIGALLCLRTFETNREDCRLLLVSRLSDGRVLQTMNVDQFEILHNRPEVENDVFLDAAPPDLLRRHREHLAAAIRQGAQVRPIENPAALVELLQNMQAEGEAALRASGKAYTDSDGALRLRLPTCFAISPRLLRRAAAAAKNARLPSPTPPPLINPESQAEKDWFLYELEQKLKRNSSASRFPKLIVMLGSLALFVTALRWSVSWETALVIVIALTFHECGHLLGMKLCGYRDTQLLFLPFFGGAAVAHDPLVLPPWKHLVILFLGPLPGIFAGIAMLLIAPLDGAPEWLRETGLMVIVFNAFNLLPILPLDGGQIVDVALVSRAPRLRAIFTAISGLALIVAGLGLGGAFLIALLGFLMLVRVPNEWRNGSLVIRLRKELPPGTGEKTVACSVIAALRAPGWKQFQLIQKLELARALQERIRRPKPGIGAIVFALLCYTSPLWLGVPVA
ncbi:MAG: site-2 protease family protein, partial [Opitutaceae bacterium]|nr:site-2 protease family protein [Opitutaceae bacterium]